MLICQEALQLPLAANVLPLPPQWRASTDTGDAGAAAASEAASAYYASVRAAAGTKRVDCACASVLACAVEALTAALLPRGHAATRRAAASADDVAHAARVSAFETLCVGVASLMVATQANVTGPELPAVPACPGALPHGEGARCDASAWDAWAVAELCTGGEDIVGKTAYPQYLVLGAPSLARVINTLCSFSFDWCKCSFVHSTHPSA